MASLGEIRYVIRMRTNKYDEEYEEDDEDTESLHEAFFEPLKDYSVEDISSVVLMTANIEDGGCRYDWMSFDLLANRTASGSSYGKRTATGYAPTPMEVMTQL